MLNVTAGWHDSSVHQIGPSVPHGAYVPLATKIKANVDVPVACAFRITSPELARELAESGAAHAEEDEEREVQTREGVRN